MPRVPGFNPGAVYGGAPGGDRIIDIIMRGGQQNSELISRGGDIWSRGIGQATDAAAGGVQAYQKDQEEQKKKAVLKAQDDAFIARLGDTANPLTPQETIKIYGNAEKGLAIHKAYESLLTPKPDEKVIMAGMEAGTPELRAAAWPAVRAHAIAAGGEPVKAAMPEQYDEGWWQKYVKARSGPEKLTDHDPTHALVGPAGNVVLPAVPAAPKPPPMDTRSLEARLAVAPPGSPEAKQILDTMRQQAEATRAPQRGVATGLSDDRQARLTRILPETGDWESITNQTPTSDDETTRGGSRIALKEWAADTGVLIPDKKAKETAIVAKATKKDVAEAKALLADPEVASEIGRYRGSATDFAAGGWIPGVEPSEKVRKFRTMLNRISAEERHRLYGSALTTTESKFANGFLPAITQPLGQVGTALDEFSEDIDRAMGARFGTRGTKGGRGDAGEWQTVGGAKVRVKR